MAYIRCDKDCNPTVQPKQKNITDAFGNTNDFFHVGYEKMDKDCNPVAQLFDPNDPNFLRPFDTTVLPNGRGGILFMDTNWTRHLSDNSAGTNKQYVEGLYFPVDGTFPPGHPDVGSGSYTVLPTDTYSNTTLLEPVYLATEGDDDLRIVDEANDDIFVISFTEPVSIDYDGTNSVNVLLNESGDNEVTDESGDPVQLNLQLTFIGVTHILHTNQRFVKSLVYPTQIQRESGRLF